MPRYRDEYYDDYHYQQEPTSSYQQPQYSPPSNNVDDNFKVHVRIRPPLRREMQVPGFHEVLHTDGTNVQLDEIVDHLDGEEPQFVTDHVFTFDKVYDQRSNQEEVYENSAREAVLSSIEGYNATILAYGQTSSGKTYSMDGFTYDPRDQQRGIIPRAVEDIFQSIKYEGHCDGSYMVSVSCLQIYQENVSDLMKVSAPKLKIKERPDGMYVDGLSKHPVQCALDVYHLMEMSMQQRATAQTRLNDQSSRSHAVFSVLIESSVPGEPTRQGKLNLVDLAGSERVRLTGATGARLQETKKINMSLSALGNVISALIEGRPHIPYRDSKLTRILEDSLGGNCKTTLLATVTPSCEFFGETLSTLKFANRAKNIKNYAHINEDMSRNTQLEQHKMEVERLKAKLKEKNRDILDKRQLIKLETEVEQHKNDKMQMLNLLEQQNREVQAEKEQRQRLEDEIHSLQNTVMRGGTQDAEEFREKMDKLEQDYAQKQEQLEIDRQAIDKDKNHQDYIKKLLINQREVLCNVTNRLYTRDQDIKQMEDENRELREKFKVLEDDYDNLQRQFILKDKELYTTSAQNTSSGTKQYPIENPELSSNPIMLTSDEKIKELSNLLHKARTEEHLLKLNLENAQNQKSDLERLVQSNVANFLTDDMVSRQLVSIQRTSSNSSQGEESSMLSIIENLKQDLLGTRIDTGIQHKFQQDLLTLQKMLLVRQQRPTTPRAQDLSSQFEPPPPPTPTPRDEVTISDIPPPYHSSSSRSLHQVRSVSQLSESRQVDTAPRFLSRPIDQPALSGAYASPNAYRNRGQELAPAHPAMGVKKEEVKRTVDELIAKRKEDLARQKRQVHSYLH